MIFIDLLLTFNKNIWPFIRFFFAIFYSRLIFSRRFLLFFSIFLIICAAILRLFLLFSIICVWIFKGFYWFFIDFGNLRMDLLWFMRPIFLINSIGGYTKSGYLAGFSIFSGFFKFRHRIYWIFDTFLLKFW
jgi:hypothetical protein